MSKSVIVSPVARGKPPAHVIRSDAEAIDVARAFAAEVAPGAAARDLERRIPFDELGRLGETGLLAVTVPRQYGGPDVSAATLVEIFLALAAADSAIAQVPQNHFVFVDVINHEATRDVQSFLLPQILAGARFGNALSERGTKTTGTKLTRLVADPAGGYRLNGRKYYCTGAYTAAWIPVTALDEQERIVVAYVERDAPGLTATPDWSSMGQRATVSGSVILDDVHVAADRIVPHWRRYERPQLLGAIAQIIHAAIHVGTAVNALAEATRYVRERARPYWEAGVERAAQDPHTMHRAGELSARLHAAEELLRKAGRVVDAARQDLTAESAAAASIAVAEAKAFGGETAVQIASDIFALTGTSATDEQHDLDRHWRNVRTHTLHDPARWKYHHIGNYLLNDVLPPRHGLL